MFYGPENLQEGHVYVRAASLQLWHLHTKTVPHSGHMNLTLMSFGMMCLLQQLHTGKVSDVDM
jgi:hypothetical protein